MAASITFAHFGTSTFYARGELLWRVGDGFEAKRIELRLDVGCGHRLGDFLLQQIDDGLRRTSRRKHGLHDVGNLVAWHSGLCHRRHIGRRGHAFFSCQGEGAQRPGLQVRGDRRQRHEPDLHLPSDYGVKRWPSPVEGHRLDVELERVFEALRGKASSGTETRRSETYFAWIGLNVGNKFLDVLHRHRRMNDENIRARAGQRHRRETFVDVIRHLFIETRVDDDTGADHEQGITIGSRVSDQRHAEIAAGAGVILDIELFAQAVAQLLCDQACHHVGGAGRRERHDDFDRPCRVARCVLRLDADTCEQRGTQQRADRRKAKQRVHRFLPFFSS